MKKIVITCWVPLWLAMGWIVLSLAWAVPAKAAGDYYLAAPGVAGEGGRFGFSLLGQWTFQERTVADKNATSGTDRSNFPFGGLGVWAGSGPFTLGVEYIQSQHTYEFESAMGGTKVQYDLDDAAWELDVRGRYFFSGQGSADRIVPYALGGLLYYNEEQDFVVTSKNANFAATGSPRLKHQVRLIGLEAGGGAIIPMSEKWGFKLEGALIYAHGERTQDNVTNTWSSKKATGLGLDAMGQVYWAITPNVSLTGGLEYRHIELGENVGRFGHFGLTTSLDFSF